MVQVVNYPMESDKLTDNSVTELEHTKDIDNNNDIENNLDVDIEETDETDASKKGKHKKKKSDDYASNKNVAEGMMDIALLSANANQLRFLITYNSQASTYYISLGLIILSLVMQVSVGIALIFKHRWRRCKNSRKRCARTNEFLVGGVFIVTVVNILLAAFTTTDGQK